MEFVILYAGYIFYGGKMAEKPFCSAALKKALVSLGLSDAYIRFTEHGRHRDKDPHKQKDQYIETIFPKSDRDIVLARLRKVKGYTVRVVRRKTKNNYFVIRITAVVRKKAKKATINVSLVSLLLLNQSVK